MIYTSAEQYFFWQGVIKAVDEPERDVEEQATEEVPMVGKVAENCREAFILGHSLGVVLTPKEYEELIEREV